MERKIKFESFEEMKNYQFPIKENNKAEVINQNEFFEMINYLKNFKRKEIDQNTTSSNNEK